MPAQDSSWPRYDPQVFESRWQQLWEEAGLYLAQEGANRPKFYCLDFFPYPSGEGLHVGHCRNYIPTDVVSRFKRMQGYNVLHPMGWDAFGEPAEQFAVTHGVHPRLTTDRNTANFRRQMRLIGAGYDWSREIDSSQPEFYRWTQFFFLLLYRRGLAYRDTSLQWWCPVCMTTLSSHEVSNGVCWRGHPGVTKRAIPAWYFKITAYADELLAGLDEIDWPEPVKAMQRNWIGRSEGVMVDFEIETRDLSIENSTPNDDSPISVFTTRPDTLYGVTFLVLAPEHALVSRLTSPDRQAGVETYKTETARRSEVERMAEAGEKTGVFTGGYAINPLSGERLPVWIADYVLPGYGTGAVMGVPAHDPRDLAFARRYGLPVRRVIVPDASGGFEGEIQEAYTGEGLMVASGPFSGQASMEGAEGITAALERRSLGKKAVQYRMRDWLISRQRYWGTPIPIVYCPDHGAVEVPVEELPVLLPFMEDFQPDGSGRSPLGRVPEFVNTTCPRCGGPATRETDTMGGFACSSWYFLRFTSPHHAAGPFEPEAMRYWMPVDLYVGGAEHAVLHLLYARFWTKGLADAGLLPFREPFARLLNQGQLLAPDGQRMSKSRGNVITPDSMVAAHGADALRVYELFMAPFDQDIQWSGEGITGARRFLNRVWDLYAHTDSGRSEAASNDPELERLLHLTIRRVTGRLESFRFNTAISALMEFANALGARQRSGGGQTVSFLRSLEALLVLLAPVAPHIAEELWQRTGRAGSVHRQSWPAWDPALAREESLQVAVQVNGRVRAVVDVPLDAGEEQVRTLALSQPKVRQQIGEQVIRNIIYVPGKVINLVI